MVGGTLHHPEAGPTGPRRAGRGLAAGSWERSALFGKKKQNDATHLGRRMAARAPQGREVLRARRTVAQTGNFAYAIDLYARGIRFDPGK